VTPLSEIASLFLRLGATAFGGPAAHIAMMRHEVVERRRWLTEEKFLDLLGATNLIPGPNSTELALHIGWERRGGAGLIVAGVSFIVPAMAITGLVAWAYVAYGSLPAVGWLLYGIKPVILAIVVQAIAALAPKAASTTLLQGVAVGVALLSWLGVHELVLLFGAGFACLAAARVGSVRGLAAPSFVPFLAVPAVPALAGSVGQVTLPSLFWVFLKTGAVLFGSGYVLLAFLRADLVERLHWLTEAQLIDAIAVGQMTPGPVFTTATFIGYVLAGPSGAVVATVGIFLPAFVFVAISGPLVPRLRASPAAGAFLDGVNAASLALMAVVTVQLGRAAVIDVPTLGLGVVSALLLIRERVNPTWLLLGGAAVGAIVHVLPL
jgi:chromate transporter